MAHPLKARAGQGLVELMLGDITRQDTEAVVNAANESLAPGGGVAGALHRAAGPGLYEECRKVAPCPTGEARITGGHELPNAYVVHTVGPVYSGSADDPVMLERCYVNSFQLAAQKGVRSIAFPALSTGIFGYPAEEAAQVALKALKGCLAKGSPVRLVRMVLYGERSFEAHRKAFERVFTREERSQDL